MLKHTRNLFLQAKREKALESKQSHQGGRVGKLRQVNGRTNRPQVPDGWTTEDAHEVGSTRRSTRGTFGVGRGVNEYQLGTFRLCRFEDLWESRRLGRDQGSGEGRGSRGSWRQPQDVHHDG